MYTPRNRTARIDHRSRLLRAAGVIGVAAIALAACGGDDDGDSAEEVLEDVEAAVENPTGADDVDESDAGADDAPAIDTAPIVECIEAADIVVGESQRSAGFMEEQGIVEVIALGAMGNEFGGGELFFFVSEERAAEQAANFEASGEEAVLQDGIAVVNYLSAVQDDVVQIVIDCAT